MRISNGVYNALVNQAIVMKHDSNQSCCNIASKIVEEYFSDDELNSEEKEELIFKINSILTNKPSEN